MEQLIFILIFKQLYNGIYVFIIIFKRKHCIKLNTVIVIVSLLYSCF